MEFFIGCSGFHYKHWRAVFYPKNLQEKNWFEYYCQHFNTVELNVTFYRFPELSVLKGWYDRSPDRFQFAVKAPRMITHYKKLHETESLIQDFYRAIDQGLRDKLGCALFQFPPAFIYTESRLELVIKSLDHSYRNVVEFRHNSWWRKEVYEALGDHGISFCGMSHPDFPDEIVNNTGFLYYRMHGKQKLYASDYSSKELETFAKVLKKEKYLSAAFIYFNNDINGYALSNAQDLNRLMLQK